MATKKTYSLDQATGEGPTLVIGGKEYKTTPLKMKHLGELKARIRSNMIMAARMAGDDTNPYLKNDLIAKVATCPLGMNVVTEEMSSPEVVQWLIWKSIVVNHPEFTMEHLDDIPMSGLDELASVLGGVFAGMHVGEDEEVSGQEAESKSPPPPPEHRSGS